jgi:hypothetical protein
MLFMSVRYMYNVLCLIRIPYKTVDIFETMIDIQGFRVY